MNEELRVIDQGVLKDAKVREYIIVSLNGKESDGGAPYYCGNMAELLSYFTDNLEDFVNKKETITIWTEKVIIF